MDRRHVCGVRDRPHRKGVKLVKYTPEKNIPYPAETDAPLIATRDFRDLAINVEAAILSSEGTLGERIEDVETRPALPYVALSAGQNLDDVRTPARYRANSQAVAGSIINSPTTQPFVCEVEATSGGLISQVVTELYGTGNAVYKRTTSSIGASPYPFGPWETVHKSGAGGKIVVASGTDIDTLRTPGDYLVKSQVIAQTLVNSPTSQPFTMRVDDNASSGLVNQEIRELYNAGGVRVFTRATRAISPMPYPFGAWQELTSNSGGSDLPMGWNSGAANALLVQDFTRRRGGRKPTGGKAVVAIRADHGLANFASKMLPLCQARGIVPSLALNSRSWGLSENTGVTEAIVDGWVAAGDVEIWNHGALGHNDANTPEKLVDAIVNGLSELRAQLPSAQVDGWVVPGVGSDPTYMGFNAGRDVQSFYNTDAGRLILEHHAISTGYIAGTHQMVLDGEVRQGGHQFTIDSQTLTAFQAEVDAAIANKTGLQIMIHPSQIDLSRKISTATLTAMLDYVVAKRDAGQLLTMSPYDMYLADSTQ